MPGTVTSTSHSPTPGENWEKQLEAYLRDAGSNNAEMRKAAELRLAIFPHTQILTHLPGIWHRELQRRERLVQVLGVVAGLLALTLIPANLFLMYLKQHEEFHISRAVLDSIGLVMMVFAQTGFVAFLGFMGFDSRVFPGAIYALVQHQCIELVPLLIEALSAPHHTPAGVDSRRPLVIAALTRLLPRFALADRKPLTPRQHAILRGELRRFNRTLCDPMSALTPDEADFLTALLAFLVAEYRQDQRDMKRQQVTELVEDLAVERTDYQQEPQARTRVREAARAALVRLSA